MHAKEPKKESPSSSNAKATVPFIDETQKTYNIVPKGEQDTFKSANFSMLSKEP
jgi:hypothetical protein